MNNGIYLLIPIKTFDNIISFPPGEISYEKIKIDFYQHSVNDCSTLLRINYPHNSPDRIKLKLVVNSTNYFNIKERIIKTIPEERKHDINGQVKFYFNMSFVSLSKVKFPNLMRLSEEIFYLKKFFKSKNQWSPPGSNYFIKDLIMHLHEEIKKNQTIEFDVILFIFAHITSKNYDFLSY